RRCVLCEPGSRGERASCPRDRDKVAPGEPKTPVRPPHLHAKSGRHQRTYDLRPAVDPDPMDLAAAPKTSIDTAERRDLPRQHAPAVDGRTCRDGPTLSRATFSGIRAAPRGGHEVEHEKAAGRERPAHTG